MHSRTLLILTSALLTLGAHTRAGAQQQRPSGERSSGERSAHEELILLAPPIGSVAEDRERLAQLRGRATSGQLLRSYSARLASALDSIPHDLAGEPAWRYLDGGFTLVSNSALPFGGNDGALWAGRGVNIRAAGGAAAAWGPFRLVLRPELIASANRDYTVMDVENYWSLPLDGRFSPYASPWNQYPYSLDLPTRFGAAAMARLDWGQSALWAEGGGVAVGLGTENVWWGPGIRNALLLSNNAGGFPHAFLRTARPWRTAAGEIEARWMVGALRESAFYDTLPGNDHRSLSAAALTWAPAGVDGLTLGAARVVIAPARNGTQPFFRWLDVFANTGRPNAVRPRSLEAGRWPVNDPRFPLVDSVTPPGRDQLMSLFFRWVFPRDGVEVYGEVGRAEMPRNLKDALLEPGHSMGYTGGVQYLRPVDRWGGALRMQGEFTYLERSSSYRHRATGSWYTSLAARQGFTNRGQVLGAAIGPGSSAQFLAADWLAPDWGFGVYAGRTRWNNDANLLMPIPGGNGWCEHDVTVYPGARAHLARRWLGTVELELALPNRMNAFFQNKSGCARGAWMRDVRSRYLSITVRPFTHSLSGGPSGSRGGR